MKRRYYTEVIKNTASSRFSVSLVVALAIHALLFLLVKKEALENQILGLMNENKSRPLKIDRIKVVNQAEVEKLRKVGIKDGVKNMLRPDLNPTRPKPTPPGGKGGQGTGGLSLGNLGPQLSNTTPPPPKMESSQALNMRPPTVASSKNSHFYFNPKVQKVIPRSQEQDLLKSEAGKGFGPTNKAVEKISNFEIRYERPEGVSEDELNSDEKAYYSFYVRSYKNYFSKIYANYEKIVIERPGLSKVFDSKHLLIGKIDYDEAGNIVTVKILKSSENDDLHYFFEETLKQLSQPNPPKVFTKNRKQFSIYYQIQIN